MALARNLSLGNKQEKGNILMFPVARRRKEEQFPYDIEITSMKLIISCFNMGSAKPHYCSILVCVRIVSSANSVNFFKKKCSRKKEMFQVFH